MQPAIGHLQPDGFPDEEDCAAGNDTGVDRRGAHGDDPAAQGIEHADAASSDMVERGLKPELGRSGDGAGQGADEKVAYGVRRGVLAGGGGGGGCGEAGEHGGQGGEAASHDVSSFVVDLSSPAF